MQLEKTDGGTHPDETLGNDADAGKIPPPENNGLSAVVSGLFRQWTMPRHAHARRGRGTERRTDAPQPFYFLLDRSAKAS